MSLALLFLVLTATVVVCGVAVAREIARDGHGRRRHLADYDSRRPTL